MDSYFWDTTLVAHACQESDWLREQFDLACVGGGEATAAERRETPFADFRARVTDAEVAALCAGAYAFIYPSRYEGFGLPSLEAMHYWCPMITTRGGSLPEVAGDAVAYRDQDSAPDLVAEVRGLQQEGRRDVLQQRWLVRERTFSWRRCGDLTLEGYRLGLNR